MSNSIRPAASCSAGRLLGWSLNHAADIILRQFSLTCDKPSYEGPCSGYRAVWDNFVASAVEEMGRKKVVRAGRHYLVKKLVSTCKSVKTVFDTPCSSCDAHAKGEAKAKWKAKAATRGPAVNPASLAELRKKVRMIVGGWSKKLDSRSKIYTEKDCANGLFEPGLSRKKSKEGYVPDQQGCYETLTSFGGTLATDDSDGPINRVRLGSLKSKGKWRVVTMQSAYVKKVLRPVHESLYDHLSSFDWLVRGDVTSKDFKRVLEGLRPDESVISGDYESATDNIYLEVVQMIVQEIAEAGKDFLTEEEKRVLIGSFEDLVWESPCESGPIVRGSMMGNLMSFPVLCILNKACFDIVCDVFDTPFDRKRYGRFNGDDCMFVGNDAFFALWEKVTSEFGLVVNREKTGRSRTFAELNSCCFTYRRNRLVAKPVLSFLKKTNEKGEILSAVLRGIRSFRMDVQLWVVNVVMRYEIACKGINPTVIPQKWRDILLRRSWFRTAVSVGPCPERRPNLLRSEEIKKKYSLSESLIEGSMSFVRGGFLDSPLECGTGSLYTFGSRMIKGKKKTKRKILVTADKQVKRTLAMVHGPIPNEKYYDTVDDLSRLLVKENVKMWRGVRCSPYKYQMDRVGAYSRYNQKKINGALHVEEGELTWLWPAVLLEKIRDEYPHVLVRSKGGDPLYHPFICYRDKFVFRPRDAPNQVPLNGHGLPPMIFGETPAGRKFSYNYDSPPAHTEKKNMFSSRAALQSAHVSSPSFLSSFASRYTTKYSHAVLRSEALW